MKGNVRTETRQVELYDTLCDVCGLKVGRGEAWDMNDATVEARIGKVYPEGDFRQKYSIDICPACFVEKLIPALESALGVRFVKEDSEQ